MKYKKGDKVRLYTWDELVDMFGVDECDTIMVRPNTGHWTKDNDNYLPKDRIVILEDNSALPSYIVSGISTDHCIFREMIKEKVSEKTNITPKQFVGIKLERTENITLNRETLLEWFEDYMRIQKGE